MSQAGLHDAPWQFCGEGGAHAVFTRAGEQVVWVLKVIKLRGEQQQLSEARDELWSSAYHARLLVQGLLGTKLMLPEVSLTLTQEAQKPLLAALHSCGRSPAPTALHTRAALMPNCCAPMGNLPLLNDPPELVVEIKPKWGFLPTSAAIPPEQELKKRVSRFQMHQHLKLAQGKISAISTYDPLSFFSDSAERVTRAVQALLQHPDQGNLVLHCNGTRVKPKDVDAVLQGWASCLTRECNRAFSDAQAAQGLLMLLLMLALYQTDVRQRLLAMQRLDRFDIACVYPAYQSYLRAQAAPAHASGPHPAGSCAPEPVAAADPQAEPGPGKVELPAAGRASADDQHLAQPGQGTPIMHPDDVAPLLLAAPPRLGSPDAQEQALHDMISVLDGVEASVAGLDHAVAVATLGALPREQLRCVLRAYLLAATAKDCSIMIGLRKDHAAGSPSPPRVDQPAGGRAVAGSGDLPGPATDAQASAGNSISDWASCPGQLLRRQIGGCWWRFRVSMIDLDVKSVTKLALHYELDKQILQHAIQTRCFDPNM